MTKFKLAALALFAALFATAPARALCLFNCDPPPDAASKIFENVVKQKFDPEAKLVKFEVTRFWRIDVEGASNKSVEYYYIASVAFPKGANLDCKPTEGSDGSKTVKAGCSASTYYSTTIQNQMVKERQYIEPGKTIEFKDETRLDNTSQGWKGQDGNIY